MSAGQTGQTGQTGWTTGLHPLIEKAIEYYGAELIVRPEQGIRVLYEATLMIPRGQTFVGRGGRVSVAMQALEEAVLADHHSETEGAR